MRLRFWGTRGSIAKPGGSTLRYGGNTSCIEVRSQGGTLVVLDCGTGAHGLGQSLVQADPIGPINGHILITHPHWDHIQGIPFFAPLLMSGSEWHIYGPRGLGPSLRDTLAHQMQHAYFPIRMDQLAATIHYHDLVEGVFEVGDIQVTAHYLNHTALCLGYALEGDGARIVYASDHEPHSKSLAEGKGEETSGEDTGHRGFLSEADVVIHDAQYTAAEYSAKQGWGHSTIEYAVDTSLRAGIRRLALFHHDPMRHDDEIDRLVESARARVIARNGSLEVCAAAEGEVLEVDGTKGATAEGPAAGSAMEPPRSGLREESVLMMVDNPLSAATLAAAVRADGLNLVEAMDEREVLRSAKSRKPSLVILERDSPRGEGLAICKALRAIENQALGDVPVILVTETPGMDVQASNLVGATDWLIMPFSEDYARAKVCAWLLRTACRGMCAELPRRRGPTRISVHSRDPQSSIPNQSSASTGIVPRRGSSRDTVSGSKKPHVTWLSVLRASSRTPYSWCQTLFRTVCG